MEAMGYDLGRRIVRQCSRSFVQNSGVPSSYWQIPFKVNDITIGSGVWPGLGRVMISQLVGEGVPLNWTNPYVFDYLSVLLSHHFLPAPSKTSVACRDMSRTLHRPCFFSFFLIPCRNAWRLSRGTILGNMGYLQIRMPQKAKGQHKSKVLDLLG